MKPLSCFSVPQASAPRQENSKLAEGEDLVELHGQKLVGESIARRKIEQCDICCLRYTRRNSRWDFLNGIKRGMCCKPEIEQRSEIQILSARVLSRWVSKPEDTLIIHEKDIGKVNSAAFLLINKLCKENNFLHFSALSPVLIMTKDSSYDFFELVNTAIEQLISMGSNTVKDVESSDGLLKTPLIITPDTGEYVFPEFLERYSQHIAFYPKLDYPKDCSGGDLVTIFINDDGLELATLVGELQWALKKAVDHTNSKLPRSSKDTIQKYLR